MSEEIRQGFEPFFLPEDESFASPDPEVSDVPDPAFVAEATNVDVSSLDKYSANYSAPNTISSDSSTYLNTVAATSSVESNIVGGPSGPPVLERPAFPEPSTLPVVDPRTQNKPLWNSQNQEPDKKSAGWGWRSLVAFVTGGLIAAGSFVGSYFLFDADDDGSNNASSEISTSSSIVVKPGEQTPILKVEGEEAAISVAEALGPAVVQIETSKDGQPFGAGSGVVYKDNLIMTNNHVIEGADVVRIRQSSGRVLEGEVLGADARIDIAVIRVKNGGLPIAQLAVGEELRVGQTAIAIGSPFLLQQTVTAGIVSALRRPVPSQDRETFVPMIQTDAPINQGNSGGALADIQGRVIGINTSIQTDGVSQANAGVGFAIPIEIALNAAEKLENGEKIESGFLGVFGEPSATGEAGVEITEVTTGSAAELGGLIVGDLVLSMDEAPVTNIAELAGLVTARSPGEIVELGVMRNGNPLVLKVTLGRR